MNQEKKPVVTTALLVKSFGVIGIVIFLVLQAWIAKQDTEISDHIEHIVEELAKLHHMIELKQ